MFLSLKIRKLKRLSHMTYTPGVKLVVIRFLAFCLVGVKWAWNKWLEHESLGGAWCFDVDTTKKKERIMIDWALIVAFVCHVERNQKPSTICYFALPSRLYRSFYCMINLDFTRRAIFGSDFTWVKKLNHQPKKAILCFIIISQIQVI